VSIGGADAEPELPKGKRAGRSAGATAACRLIHQKIAAPGVGTQLLVLARNVVAPPPRRSVLLNRPRPPLSFGSVALEARPDFG
jgi:hypothetical protein